MLSFVFINLLVRYKPYIQIMPWPMGYSIMVLVYGFPKISYSAIALGEGSGQNSVLGTFSEQSASL